MRDVRCFLSRMWFLLRGELAAILGPNGAGKTTFLKTLLGIIPAYDGVVKLGASLKIGYFAQAHENLHPQWTLMEEIEAVSPGMLPAEIRNYLARFLFTEDDVFKQVEMLSGGERGRLALACLALQGANLLLLDEPTNHLDLPSQEILESMLADYNGTILLVSHDRYLIDALATQVWEVLPQAQRLRVFKGSYSEYRSALQAEAVPVSESKPKQNERSREDSTQSNGKNRLSTNEARKRLNRLQKLEDEITELEEKLAAISRQFELGNLDASKAQKLSQEYLLIQKQMDEKLDLWTKLSES